MSEDLSHLIEIGDPEDDPVVPVPEAQVVIEYRDRGLPWMLVLPLLVTAAAVAIIGFKAFDNRVSPAQEIESVSSPAPASIPVAEAPPVPSSTSIFPEGYPLGSGGMSPQVPSPIALPLASIPPEAVIPPEVPAASLPAVVEAPALAEPPVVPPVEEVRPFPQIASNGFDPKAFTEPEAMPEDSDDVRPAGHPGDIPQPGIAFEAPAQPQTVDPRNLPPDPSLAKRERFQRWVESRNQLDIDRVQFHAELRAIIKRFSANPAPAIADLCRRSGTEPDPIAKAQAARMLTVAAAGVDPAVRVNLLRSFGFPEASILIDIAETKSRWEDGKSRYGPKTSDEILRRAAMFLLQCPPKKSTAAARPTAASPSNRPAGSLR